MRRHRRAFRFLLRHLSTDFGELGRLFGDLARQELPLRLDLAALAPAGGVESLQRIGAGSVPPGEGRTQARDLQFGDDEIVGEMFLARRSSWSGRVRSARRRH